MFKEEELIKRAIAGDEKSFEKLIDLYKNYVFAIILKFIKDHGEVENIAQEVFLQIYISLPNYKSDNFKGWISRITSNKSIDWLRSKKAKFREEVMENSQEVMDSPRFSQSETPEDVALELEKNETIHRMCKSLPPIYKDTITKFYFQGKSYEEIALEEDVTVKTIASRLYRGRNMLKEKWREES